MQTLNRTYSWTSTNCHFFCFNGRSINSVSLHNGNGHKSVSRLPKQPLDKHCIEKPIFVVKGDEYCAVPLVVAIDLCFYFVSILLRYFDWLHTFMLQCAFLKTKMLHPSPADRRQVLYSTLPSPYNDHVSLYNDHFPLSYKKVTDSTESVNTLQTFRGAYRDFSIRLTQHASRKTLSKGKPLRLLRTNSSNSREIFQNTPWEYRLPR